MKAQVKLDKTAVIQRLTNAAFTATVEQLESALKALEKKQEKRNLGTARKAAEIAEKHPMTIKRWAKLGLLHPVRINKRVVRFDLDEVFNLVNYGAGEVTRA